MNEGDPKNREYWFQIITTIPEISSTDHGGGPHRLDNLSIELSSEPAY